jgi:hypothetical protein
MIPAALIYLCETCVNYAWKESGDGSSLAGAFYLKSALPFIVASLRNGYNFHGFFFRHLEPKNDRLNR